ncbi:MAG: hypothetical protein FMNOHCHN_01984 [Ignavibacteriaceae bacterium]|nr:hypothetical protein [Ignavibacteriaceae bacterium]
MYSIKFYSALFSVILMTNFLFGQEDFIKDNELVLNAGVSLPMGDFSATKGEKGGYGMTGFAGRIDFSQFVNQSLSWTSSLALSFNSIDENEVDKQIKSVLGNSVSASAENYTSLWGISGFSFKTTNSPNFALYGIIQVGILKSFYPDFKISGPDGTATQTAESSFAFAFSMGTGLQINNINIGIRYLSGEPEYKQTSSLNGDTSSSTVKMPMTLLVLSAGIVF